MVNNMEKILRRVYSSKRITLSLSIISYVSVALAVISYALIIWKHFSKSTETAMLLLVFSAVPFLLVSAWRRFLNAPRPYEMYNFYDVLPKNKKGRSFPSRHVFSIFLIATFAVTISPYLFAALIILGVALAVSRVLLGVHFIRDVVAGAIIGSASALIGIFLAV